LKYLQLKRRGRKNIIYFIYGYVKFNKNVYSLECLINGTDML